MFMKASRLKLRFDSAVGKCSVEDLWDLPLTSTVGKPNLDDIARQLNKQMKNGDDVSFVIKEKKTDEITSLKFDIVKYIIDVRLGENAAAAAVKDLKDKKQQLLSLVAAKEVEALGSKSIDELKAMIGSLGV